MLPRCRHRPCRHVIKDKSPLVGQCYKVPSRPKATETASKQHSLRSSLHSITRPPTAQPQAASRQPTQVQHACVGHCILPADRDQPSPTAIRMQDLQPLMRAREMHPHPSETASKYSHACRAACRPRITAWMAAVSVHGHPRRCNSHITQQQMLSGHQAGWKLSPRLYATHKPATQLTPPATGRPAHLLPLAPFPQGRHQILHPRRHSRCVSCSYTAHTDRTTPSDTASSPAMEGIDIARPQPDPEHRRTGPPKTPPGTPGPKVSLLSAAHEPPRSV